MTTFPTPDITRVNAPYWEGLRAGVLRYQHCGACGNRWLPFRDACPRCLAPSGSWRDAGGAGRLVSWVVYHVAYHEAFAGRLPYIVACVELQEGPRLLTNLVAGTDASALAIDMPVELQIEYEGDLALARFRCAPQAQGVSP